MRPNEQTARLKSRVTTSGRKRSVSSTIQTRNIIGTAVSITDYDAVLDAIEAAIASNSKIYICATPASSLVFARDDAAMASALADATIVTPDGMGVVLAARLLGESIRSRVYGPDLMQMQMRRAADRPLRTATFLYGGHDRESLDMFQAVLTATHSSGIDLVGSYLPPHRELTADETAEVISQINASGAKIVWVGIGSPKQEVWMQRMRDALDAPVLVGVGAAFDFLSGRVSQAPRWMQRVGLEWLYRILQDPRRLGKRYALTLPRFVCLVVTQAVRERLVR